MTCGRLCPDLRVAFCQLSCTPVAVNTRINEIKGNSSAFFFFFVGVKIEDVEKGGAGEYFFLTFNPNFNSGRGIKMKRNSYS